MFSKNKKPATTTAPSPPTPAPSIVSADMRVIGDITSQGEVQIDGTVEGDVRAKSVLIGESADIKGEILADQVQVHGRVNGLIKSRSVHLGRAAHVVGDILHESMSIENGAFLEGHCIRMNDSRGTGSMASEGLTPLARVTGKDSSVEVKKQTG
jgi:cytoskeletal protein CcmA (bactofilin family)